MTYPSRILQKGEVRLLTLLPGCSGDGIECTLSIHCLQLQENQDVSQRITEYEALSYTWGGSMQSFITLDGVASWRVADNLFHALRRLRHAELERCLWIDALCINQADEAERSAQVQDMRLIYRNASRVIVWLGEPVVSPSDWAKGKFEYRAILESLKLLLERQRPLWWERLWIIQEMSVCDQEPVVHFGKWRITWPDLNEHLAQLVEQESLGLLEWSDDSNFESGDLVPSALGYFARLQDIREKHREGMTSLCVLGVHASNANSSVRKDKVYGLLGLIPDHERQQVLVDYSRSDTEVFASATIASMRANASLNYLIIVPMLRDPASDLPSWTVNFDSGSDFSYTQREALVHHAESRTSSEKISHCRSYNDTTAALSEDYRLLTVAGVSFDAIDQVFDLPPAVPFEDFTTCMIKMLTDITENPYANLTSRLSDSGIGSHTSSCLCRPRVLDNERLALLPDVLNRIYRDRQPEEYRRDITAETLEIIFKHWIRRIWGEQKENELHESIVPSDFAELLTADAQLFRTQFGFVGTAPGNLRSGDRVVLLSGCDWPVVLRKTEDGGYLFHGLAWIQGIMEVELETLCFYLGQQEDFVLC